MHWGVSYKNFVKIYKYIENIDLLGFVLGKNTQVTNKLKLLCMQHIATCKFGYQNWIWNWQDLVKLLNILFPISDYTAGSYLLMENQWNQFMRPTPTSGSEIINYYYHE